MATDYEDDLLAPDDKFQARIDDLVSSALEDQAREKRFLMEMVSAAKAALSKAEHELSSLRQMVEHRDESVVDLLETRLSGIGTERSIEDLSAKINMMLERPPVDEMVVPIIQRIGELAAQIVEIQNGLKPLDPWPAAIEIQRMIAERVEARLQPIADAVAEARRETLEVVRTTSDDVAERVAHRMNAAEEALAGDVDVMQEAVVQRLDSGLERSSSAIADRLAEAVERLDSGFESGMTDIGDKLQSGASDIANKWQTGVTDIGDKLETAVTDIGDKFESGVTEVSERLEDLQRRVAEEVSERLSALFQDLAEVRADLREMFRSGQERTSEHMSALVQELATRSEESVSELQSKLGNVIEGGNAQVFDRIQQVESEIARIVASVAEIPSSVETGFSELQTFTAQREQDLREAIHSFGGTIAEGEQKRSEVLSEQIARVASTIDSYRPTLSRAIHDAMTPFSEEVRALGERIRQTNRRITESNSRLEAMHESLIAYLSVRDERLEMVRERSVIDMFDQLEEALSAKERAKLAGAMKLSRQRRQDRRDAERYRKLLADAKPVSDADRELILEEMTQAKLASRQAQPDAPVAAPTPVENVAAPEPRAIQPKDVTGPSKPRAKPKQVQPSAKSKPKAKSKSASPKAQRKRAV